ncbi:hypothetical protein PIB30_015743 [Stylosanthes scabra]|uniref:Uncharacterized protein n=1 Tax=Stylosanthes scabra TaxID=79078 RepID=A0ABU6X7D6_9FABA|nr:hypothetical protein [Stylosanthes scabra]
MLQQQIEEVRSLKSTLTEKDARAEDHLRRVEEMSRMMASFYDPLRPRSSATAGGVASSTAPPLPPRPPPRHRPPEGDDDDDNYEDACKGLLLEMLEAAADALIIEVISQVSESQTKHRRSLRHRCQQLQGAMSLGIESKVACLRDSERVTASVENYC